MRTINYALAGKEVRADLVGKTVTIRVPESWQECVTLCGGDETLAVEKFADAYVIAVQGTTRRAAGAKDATVESVNAKSSTAVLKRRAEGTGQSDKPATPETVAKRAAVSSGNKLFDKMEQNEKFRDRMFKELENEEEFNAYIAAKNAPKTPRATRRPAAETAQA